MTRPPVFEAPNPGPMSATLKPLVSMMMGLVLLTTRPEKSIPLVAELYCSTPPPKVIGPLFPSADTPPALRMPWLIKVVPV